MEAIAPNRLDCVKELEESHHNKPPRVKRTRSKLSPIERESSEDFSTHSKHKRLRHADDDSIEEDTKATAITKTEPLPTLYSMRLIEPNSPDRLFYSANKFNGWKEPLSEVSKDAIALIELVRDVSCTTARNVPRKKTMKKEQFKSTELHVDLEKDVECVKQNHPYMNIHSKIVQAVLRYLIKYDPNHNLVGRYMIFHWPWEQLLIYYKDIEAFLDQLHKEARSFPEELRSFDVGNIQSETRALLDIIKPEYTELAEEEFMLHSESSCATFNNLNLLFRPGEQVYMKLDGELVAAIVVNIAGTDEHSKAKTYPYVEKRHVETWHVEIWRYCYVGGNLCRHMSEVVISHFIGRRQITSLPVFPSKYFDITDENGHRAKLTLRGKNFLKVLQHPFAHMNYSGMTLGQTPRGFTGKIVIDPVSWVSSQSGKEYQRVQSQPTSGNAGPHDPLTLSDIVQPRDFGGGAIWHEYNSFDPKEKEICSKLQDKHYILFPRRIQGMSLKEKRWEVYDVDLITPIIWQDRNEALQRLLIDQDSMDTIKSTCRSAMSRKKSPNISTDWIGGKGAGQVFLFYECIAEYTQQPLIALTHGDLYHGGHNSQEERRLSKWFHLAKTWDAHILIDEADIFTERRQPGELQRNALVSVFLRNIEYFSGMLFLTTNRFGLLDTAIKSRIQVSIHFPDFDKAKRKDLWERFFEKLRNNESITITPDTVIDFFSHKCFERSINGRDIRNILQHSLDRARFGSSSDIEEPNESFELKVPHLVKSMERQEELDKNHSKANDVENEQELAQLLHERAHERDD